MQRRIQAELGRDRGETGLTLEAAAIDRLQSLNAKLFRAPDAIAVLTETMDAARTLLDADMGSAELYDPKTGELELVAARGFAFDLPSDARRVKPGSGSICALALEARRQVAVEDILAEPRCEPVHAASRMAGVRGALATPLFDHAGTLIAVVSVYFARPHRPAEAELRILDLLLHQATHLVERFYAEDALRSSERLFAALFEQAACGIASVDLDGRLKMVNDRFCEILGRTRAELLTQRVLDLTHPDDVPRNLELLDRALKEGRPYAMEKRYLRGDGMEVWVSVDVSPLYDARGTTVATMGICQDITQRKQTEEALREADRRKDEFLAMLAHELRNPLAPIVNALASF